jgi:hypothetical protein
MSSTSEIGHEKNIANFEDLISRCVGFGTAYNPSLNAIKVANMNALKTSASTAQTSATSMYNLMKNASNNREVVFLPLKKLSTRIMAALKSCGATTQTINDALTYNRKLQGKRAKPIKEVSTEENRTPSNETPIDPNVVIHISTSQQGYDSKIEFFAKLIDMLGTVPSYAPNEADLKLTALNALLTNMKTSNTAVITATTNFKTAMLTRNAILYKMITGLVDIAQECKNYVKSVFGATSGSYKLVSVIKFNKRKGILI